MSDVIRQLPDSVANQIAAGEVIQRPASIIKELVENSVDAGADNIKVIIRDSGRTLVQVVDNGCGMSPTDARLSFERHATSKISLADDLTTLRTMGFRGEALASIAAVAQVEMITQRREDTVGTKIIISGSQVESQGPAASSAGTSIAVKNLFFNVPARRKFLKKDSIELSHILHEFERLALVNPEIELSIYHNDVLLHQLTRGTLKQRIGALFGKAIEKQLIPVATETSMVKIEGFVALPEYARRRGALQYLFVNGRNMRHPYFDKAISHCYENLIHADEKPQYFVNFIVDPATIDVNIHPTKNEIKFENEQAIWQILAAAVREALGRSAAMPSIDFDNPSSLDIPVYNPDVNALRGLKPGDENYNPFTDNVKQSGQRSHSSTAAWNQTRNSVITNWDKLYDQFSVSTELRPDTSDFPQASSITSAASPTDNSREGEAATVSSKANGDSLFYNETQEVTTILQIKNKYIVTPGSNGMIVVDCHRAHVLVLYERFMSANADKGLPAQKVLFPELVNLSPQQSIKLREVEKEFATMGFELESAGRNVWAINAVPPADLNEGTPELIKNILNDLLEETGGNIGENVRRIIALNTARAGAIRGGRPMTDREMERLLSELFSLRSPRYTPDGLKIFDEITIDDLASLLG